jgi:hypothetical protein
MYKMPKLGDDSIKEKFIGIIKRKRTQPPIQRVPGTLALG